MALYSEDTATRSFLPLEEIPATFSDVVRAQYRSSLLENPSVALERMRELSAAEERGTRLSKAAADEVISAAGLKGQLTVEEDGISNQALSILIARKQDEIQRLTTLSRGRGGLGEGATRLGVALATSLLDPVNIAAAFVPIVGEARYARLLQQAGGGVAARVGVRAGVGALEGTAGAAIVEPLIYTAKQQEQADYEMADSLMNLAFGSLFGGGLHVVGGAGVDLVRSFRRRPLPENIESEAHAVSDEILAERVETDITGTQARRADSVKDDPAAAQDDYTVSEGILDEDTAQLFRRAESRLSADQDLYTTVGGGRPAEQWLEGTRAPRARDGSPRTFYRGAALPLETNHFEFDALGHNTQRPTSALGVFFTSDRAEAARYGSHIEEAHFDFRNPKVVRPEELPVFESLKEAHAWRESLRKQGHDGIVIDASDVGGPVWPVAFTPDSVIRRKPAQPTAAQRAAEASPRVQEAALRTAVGQMADGRTVDVEPLFAGDPPAVARAAARASETPDPQAIRQAEISRAVDDEIRQSDTLLETAEDEAALAEAMVKEHGKVFDYDAANDPTIEAAQAFTKRAERWSRAAEIATACLIRGA